ncbi:NUDIX hydrolase [Nakamurella sp.]|uniref:NUDIX hydrolase n=1 Tax=Nakamurella sp. TaxID=1869182 RepID=UPI003B3A5C4F
MAGVVVNDEGQVLVVQRRDNGDWQPPGGILELDETIEEGLRREVREETGIEITVGPLTGVYKNMRLSVVALVFRCAYSSGAIGSSDETGQVRWLSFEEAIAIMQDAFAVRVRDAMTTTNGAKQLSHNGTDAP